MSRNSFKFWLVPELRLLDAPDQQTKVYSAAFAKIPAHRVCGIALMGAVLGVGFAYANEQPPFQLNFVRFLGFPFCLLLSFGALLICRQSIRRSVRADLQKLGVPICIACGYALRGLTEPRCPECGTEFDPELIAAAPSEPRAPASGPRTTA